MEGLIQAGDKYESYDKLCSEIQKLGEKFNTPYKIAHSSGPQMAEKYRCTSVTFKCEREGIFRSRVKGKRTVPSKKTDCKAEVRAILQENSFIITYVEHTHDHTPKQWTNDELSSIKKQNDAGSVANDEVLKKTEEMVRKDVHIQEKESADDVVKKTVNEQMVRKEQHAQKPESSSMQYNVETVTQDSLPFEQPSVQDHNFVNESTLDDNVPMYTKKANVEVGESTIVEEKENIEFAHQGNNDFEEPESPTMEQYSVESSLMESSTLGHCEKLKNDQELDKIISTLRQNLYLIRDQESEIFFSAKTTVENLNNNLEEQINKMSNLQNVVIPKNIKSIGRPKGFDLNVIGLKNKKLEKIFTNKTIGLQKYTMLEWMKLLPGEIENVLDGVYRFKFSDLKNIDSFIQHFLDKEVNVDLLKEHFEDKAFKQLKKVINTKGKSNAYTCGKCSEDIGELRTVLCDSCMLWFHFHCANLSKKPKESIPFMCPTCTREK